MPAIDAHDIEDASIVPPPRIAARPLDVAGPRPDGRETPQPGSAAVTAVHGDDGAGDVARRRARDEGDHRLVVDAELSLEAARIESVGDGAGLEDTGIIDEAIELADLQSLVAKDGVGGGDVFRLILCRGNSTWTRRWMPR